MKTSGACPLCGGKLSLWTGIKAPTPFRLRCPGCGARLGIKIRRFWAFAVVAALFAVATIVGCALARIHYGRTGLFLALACFALIYLVLELATGLVFYTCGEIIPMNRKKSGRVPAPQNDADVRQ